MTKRLEPILRANLLEQARAYAALRKSSLRTVSRQMHGDPPFFDNLASGSCSFTARKYDEVMAKFDEADWTGVLRPVPKNPIHGRFRKPPLPKRKKAA